jgi:rubrerythrin
MMTSTGTRNDATGTTYAALAMGLLATLAAVFLLMRSSSRPQGYVEAVYRCSSCGTYLEPNSKYCGKCGAQLIP